MFRVLNNLPRTSSGVQPVPQKDYLIREVQRNLQTIRNHYQGFTFAVQSDHILALLLAQLPMRYDISVQTYYDMILDLTPELGNRVKLITSRYAGKLFDGAFYPGLHEAIIATGESRLISRDVLDNWRNWSPVRIVTHPYANLRYIPLHRKPVEEGRGFAVIMVDVPLLALQYRMWSLVMGHNVDGKWVVKEPVTSFLASFPLVNALYSHNDVVIRNRCLWVSPAKNPLKSPIYVNDLDNVFSQVVLSVQHHLLRRRRSYTDMLKQIPSLYGDQYQATRMGYTVDLRQTRWARDLGCLSLWQQLVTLQNVSESVGFSSQADNDLYRAADRSLKEGNWESSPLPGDLRREVIAQVADLLKILPAGT